MSQKGVKILITVVIWLETIIQNIEYTNIQKLDDYMISK